MVASFEVVATGLKFPEGPIAMSDGSVLLVEIERGVLSRISPAGVIEVVADLGGGPNGAAIGPDGACYVCNNGGFTWIEDELHGLRPVGQARDYVGGSIQRVDLKTGVVTTLYEAVNGFRLSGPNDIVFDRTGGFWFTDLGKVRSRDLDHGGIYYARPDGSAIHEVVFPAPTPNGIGLSADETRLYVAETGGGRLWEYELSAPGVVKRSPFPSPNGGRMIFGSSVHQRFDSLALDSAGNICVATLFNSGVTVISPLGDLVEHVPSPDLFTTNICFGGPDLSTAYVTLSSTGQLVRMRWPRRGLPLNFLNK